MDFKEYRNYIMPMDEFLRKYVGITTQLELLRRATHKDVKFLNFSNVQAVSFQNITKENIYTGEVILVKDGKNNIAPYLNPNRNLIKAKKKERKM